MKTSRRGLVTGLVSFVALAPAIVKVRHIMPVKPWKPDRLVTVTPGLWSGPIDHHYRWLFDPEDGSPPKVFVTDDATLVLPPEVVAGNYRITVEPAHLAAPVVDIFAPMDIDIDNYVTLIP